MQKKEIKFSIQLDDNKNPESIEWSATDADFDGEKPVQAIMVHMWDKEQKSSLNFDLWTKEMLVQHMSVHYFYSLMSMADSYERSTKNTEAANKMREFAQEFAQMTRKA